MEIMSCVKWTIFMTLLSRAVSQILCPDVVELKSASRLTCIFSSTEFILYKRSDKITMASCLTDRTSCIINNERDRFNGTVVNTTHSVLEIREIRRSDEGEWICENKDAERTQCTLTVKKAPSCNITADKDTSGLYVGEEITMSVVIDEDYYCTTPVMFSLKSGSITMELVKTDTTIFKSTLNLTDLHFGPVKLSFVCGRSTEDISCGGIKHLYKHPVIPTVLPSTPCCVTKTTPSGLDENKIAIISVFIAAVALITAFIISVFFCVKLRAKSSKTLPVNKQSCPYADVADSINSRPKNIQIDAEGYAEVADIKGSFRNKAFDKGSVDTKDEFTIIPCKGYVEKYKNVVSQLNSPSLSKKTQVFTLEDTYSTFPCERERHRYEC